MRRTTVTRSTKYLLACGTLWLALIQAAPAQADHKYQLSIFDYGLQGFGAGLLIGASTGYLLERDGDWTSTNTRNLLIATAIGAVGGAGVGVLVGLLDQAADRPGFGVMVMRNITMGATLGALVGAATGAIVWAADGSGRDLLFGASLGTLIGAGAGLIFGIFEGARVTARESASATETRARASKASVRFDLGTVMQNEQLILVPGLRGQF